MSRRRRISKAEAQAFLAEVRQIAPVVLASPAFVEFAQRRPLTAMLWRVLAERTRAGR